MSWPQWSSTTQPPVPSVLAAAQPVINSAPAVVPPGIQYTPEQWAQLQQQNWNQWAQWQQQYQQWHQQYGAEYQKSMNALAQAAHAQQLPNVTVPPPLPVETKPPLPTEEPPPNVATYPPQPAGPPQGYNTAPLPKPSELRPPVHYPKPNQNWQNRDYRYGQEKRPYEQGGGHEVKRPLLSKPEWQAPPPPVQAPVVKPKDNEELSEAEKKFDKQFADWEAQFNKWKEQNVEHPDKEQYREYEKKWESWRAQLLERREQMKRKRLGLSVESPNRGRPSPGLKGPNNQEFNAPQGYNQNQQFNQKGPQKPANSGPGLPPPSLGPGLPPPSSGPGFPPGSGPGFPPPSSGPGFPPPGSVPGFPPPNAGPGFVKPPPTLNDEPLQFKGVPEPEDPGSTFFKPNTGGGIPGLDLVKDEPKPKEKDDVVVIDPEEKEKEKPGPDFDAISKGINSILGDPKLLNMLSIVSQNQNPQQGDSLTNTVSKIGNNLESNSLHPPFPEQSSQSYEEHSNHSDNHGQREFVNNFDDQTRSSFTMAPNEETRFEGPGGFNRNQNQFGNRFGNLQGNRFGGHDDDKFAPPEDRFGPGPNRFGPNQDRFGPKQNRFGPNQERFGPNQERFGSNQNQGRFEPPMESQFGSNQDRPGPGPHQGKFNQNQGRFGAGPDKFDNHGQDRFGPNQNRFGNNQERQGPNQGRPGPNQDRFGMNQDRQGPNQDRFGMNQDRQGPNQDRFGFGPNQGRFGPNQNRCGPNEEAFAPSKGRFEPNLDRLGSNQGRFGGQQDKRFGQNQDRFIPSDQFDENEEYDEQYNEEGFEDYQQGYEENCDDYDYDAVAANFENDEPVVPPPPPTKEVWEGQDSFLKGNFKESHPPAEVSPEKPEEIFQPVNVIDYEHKSAKNAEVEVLIEPIHMFDYRHKPLSRIPLPQRPKWLSEEVRNIREFDPPVVRSYEPPNLRRYPPRNDRYSENRPPSNRRNFDDRPPFEERRNFDDRPPYEDRRYNDRNSKWEDRKPYNDERNYHQDERRPPPRIELEEEKISDTEWPEDEEMELPQKPLFPTKFQKVEETKPVPKKNVVLIEDLISPPGRYKRPPRLVIILRGPPGSGKTFLAKLIKDKEVENGGSAPRILSLDDYFMVEQEKEVTEDGKKVKIKEMVYEYEAEMEESYRTSLIKSFKKTITDGYFSFIIVDNVNDKVKYFGEMWSFAKQNGFQVYICQLDLDVQTCSRRNTHGRSEADIDKCVANWEPTPSHHPILDATSLLQAGSIPEVEMEEVNSPESDVREHDGSEDQVARSKWDNFDCSVDNLAKLDGVSKPLRHRTMEEYLQLDTDWTPSKPTKPGQKRVRWADLEEQKQQEKMRAIGFVVGQTNWKRMMDPSGGSSALTQTKYIERTGRYKVDQMKK